jgi:hypothetical protein
MVMVSAPYLTTCVFLQDFDLAVSNLELLLERETAERKAKIYSALGRVYLQLGQFRNIAFNFLQLIANKGFVFRRY